MSETNAQTGDTSGGKSVPVVDVAKAESDAVKACMGQVTALVEGIAKAAGVSLDGGTEGAGDAQTGDDDTDVDTTKAGDMDKNKKGMRKMYEKQLRKAGMKDDAVAKAMADFDKEIAPATSTQKSTDGGDADATTTQEDTIKATLDTIQKAKAMTPARIAKLQAAMEELQKLMMEVITPGSSPATRTPAVSQHSNPNTTRAALVGTMKRDDMEGVLKALSSVLDKLESVTGAKTEPVSKSQDGEGDIKAALQSIQKRLEAIEGARPAPTSQGGDNTDTKVRKSFWAGVL